MDNRTLCIQLAYFDTETEVIRILKKAGYWDNNQQRIYYRGKENNFFREERCLHN